MSAPALLHGIRAVVFDAVGTVIFPEPPAAVVYAQVGRCYGSRLPEAEIQTRFVEAFRREEALDRANGLRTSEAREIQRWQDIVAHALPDVHDAGRCFADLWDHFHRPTSWRCAVDAEDVIGRLAREGFALGLASNYDHRLRAVAAGLPPLKPLQELVISSEIGWRKPAPEFFARVVAAFGLPPDQVAYVGDDPENDYAGAQAHGLRAVLLDSERRLAQGRRTVTSLTQLL